MQRYFSHICDVTDVQADWRRSCTYRWAPDAIDISQGSLRCPSYTDTWPPFLAHLSRRLKWAIVIAHRPSVRRKLSHFRLLLWNCWTEFNKTWQEGRSQRSLQSLCFSGRSEKQDGCPGFWLAETFSTSSLKPLNRIQLNLTGSKISTPLPSLCFSGRSEKQDGRPGLWLAETFSTSSLNLLNRIHRNFTGSKISTPSTKFVFFGLMEKNKMAAPDSDWLRHFRLLCRNRWTEFNETRQEARSQRSLPSLCFSGRSEKQDGRPGFWLAETFKTSPLKQLNRIQQNLIESKTSKPSTGLSLCFSGRSEKQDGRPGLWLHSCQLTPLSRVTPPQSPITPTVPWPPWILFTPHDPQGDKWC